MLDRRRFLLSSGIASGLLYSACKTTGSMLHSGDSSNNPVRRRWTNDGNEDFKKKYIEAVTWLKANDQLKKDGKLAAGDPRSYLTYNTILLGHQRSCHHGEWLIFPWHRLYLQYFEQACRFALQDANFALPYWDWTQDRSIPHEFYEVDVLKADRGLGKDGQIPEEFVAQKVIDDILNSQEFTSVHSRAPRPAWLKGGRGVNLGAFERAPHNGVHNSIGGIMANPFDSPTDPIFWLHHCNIDRIWSMWQQRHPSLITPPQSNSPLIEKSGTVTPAVEKPGSTVVAPKPADGAALAGGIVIGGPSTPWEDTVLEIDLKQTKEGKDLIPSIPASAFTRSVAGSATVRSILDIDDLGYIYDTTDKEIPLKIIKKRVVTPPAKRTATIFTGKTDRRGDTLVSIFALNSKDLSESVNLFVQEMNSFVNVVAEGIVPPTDDTLRQETIIRIFLVPGPSYESRPEFMNRSVMSLPEYVGVQAFFGHDHEGDGTITANFNISRWLRTYLDEDNPTELSLVAIALNPKKDFTGVPLFPSSSQAELKLEFNNIIRG